MIQLPLVEATIEVRFAGDARMETVRGQFQQEIIDDYPQLLVPKADINDYPALQPYRFQSLDGTSSLALSVNAFALSSRRYPGWQAFKSEFSQRWAALLGKAEPRKLTRVGMRYVNLFDGSLSARLNFDGNTSYLQPLKATASDFHRSATNFDLNGLGLLVNVTRTADLASITLDYDAYCLDVALEDVDSTLESLHKLIEDEFLNAITEPARREISQVSEFTGVRS